MAVVRFEMGKSEALFRSLMLGLKVCNLAPQLLIVNIDSIKSVGRAISHTLALLRLVTVAYVRAVAATASRAAALGSLGVHKGNVVVAHCFPIPIACRLL